MFAPFIPIILECYLNSSNFSRCNSRNLFSIKPSLVPCLQPWFSKQSGPFHSGAYVVCWLAWFFLFFIVAIYVCMFSCQFSTMRDQECILHCACLCGQSLQSCLTLCYPMDYSLLDSSVHRILRQEYWSGLPCPPPGDCPIPGIKPVTSALQVHSSHTEPPGKPVLHCIYPSVLKMPCVKLHSSDTGFSPCGRILELDGDLETWQAGW